MFCSHCGAEIADKAVICVKCGVATGVNKIPVNTDVKSRLIYIVLAIFLGCFGIHNFYAGYTGKAVAQLLICLLIGWLILPLLGLFVWIVVDICTVTKDANNVPFTS